MMIPEPEASSVARLTLFPGLPSTSSTLGIESPTLTMIAIVAVQISIKDTKQF